MVRDKFWHWNYRVEIIHTDQNFHEINQWLDDNIGVYSEDWSGYGNDQDPSTRRSVYLFVKKEHAILFKTVWV